MSAVIFDLDGTLAPIGLPIPPEVADGLRLIESSGRTVAICSGKPLAYLCGLLRQVGLHKPILVGENGAAMQIGVDLPPMIRGTLPYPESARKTLETIRKEIDRFYSGQVWYQPNEHMLTCFPHSDELFDPIEQLIDRCGAVESGLVVYRHCDCFDIIPSGIDKGAGLLELCRMLNISPADTIAVGDHDNDLPMFRAAGLSIAVGGFAPAEARLHFDTIHQAMEYILNM